MSEYIDTITKSFEQYVNAEIQDFALAHKEALSEIKLGLSSTKKLDLIINDIMKDCIIDRWKCGDDYFDTFVYVKDIGIGERKGYKCGRIYIDEFRETEGRGFYRYGEHKIRNHCKIQGSPAENARHYQRAPIQTEF